MGAVASRKLGRAISYRHRNGLDLQLHRPPAVDDLPHAAHEGCRHQTGNLGLLFALFVGIYVILLFLTAFVLLYYFKRHPASKELNPQMPVLDDEGVRTHV